MKKSKIYIKLAALALFLTFQHPQNSLGVSIPVYYGLWYPTKNGPPVLEIFIIKDMKLELTGAYVDTDGDFLLDSSITFMEDGRHVLGSFMEKDDPFTSGATDCIKAEPQDKFDFRSNFIETVGGRKIKLSFFNQNNYPIPESCKNKSFRDSAIFKKFSKTNNGDQSQ